MDNPWRKCAGDILGTETGIREEGAAIRHCFKEKLVISKENGTDRDREHIKRPNFSLQEIQNKVDIRRSE